MKYLSISEENLMESKNKLKDTLEKNIKENAFRFLIEKAQAHSKVNETIYSDVEGARHFKDSRFSPDIVSILFRFRTRMFLVKNNFRNNYVNTDTLCPLCKCENDSQEHLLECTFVKQEYGRPIKYEHSDIFSNNMDTLFGVASTLKELVDVREQLLNQE